MPSIRASHRCDPRPVHLLCLSIALLLFHSDIIHGNADTHLFRRESHVELTLDNLHRFNELIVNKWDQWAKNTPITWREDGFLLEHVPVGVSLRFGQNQRISVSRGSIEQEALNWQNERTFEKCKLVYMAIATHIE